MSHKRQKHFKPGDPVVLWPQVVYLSLFENVDDSIDSSKLLKLPPNSDGPKIAILLERHKRWGHVNYYVALYGERKVWISPSDIFDIAHELQPETESKEEEE